MKVAPRILWTAGQDQASTSTATFDAVMVCNGHYSAPRRPALPGAELFPGRVLHSHSYRTNAPYAGLTVVVIGASASGEDISREIALVADKVLACAVSSACSWSDCICPICVS